MEDLINKNKLADREREELENMSLENFEVLN